MGQQGVDQGAVRVARRRMDHHPRRLVQDQEVPVLIEDVERQRLNNIITGTRAGTWEWNLQTDQAIVNARWAEMLGYTLDEVAALHAIAPIRVLTLAPEVASEVPGQASVIAALAAMGIRVQTYEMQPGDAFVIGSDGRDDLVLGTEISYGETLKGKPRLAA